MGFFYSFYVFEFAVENNVLAPTLTIWVSGSPTLVSWQSIELPNEQWKDLGKGSLFSEKRFDVEEARKYKIEGIVTEIKNKRGKTYGFKIHFTTKLGRDGLFHFILPKNYVPDQNSFQNNIPYIKKINNQISLTFFETGDIDIELYVYKISDEQFDKIPSLGNVIMVNYNPKYGNQFNSILGTVEEKSIKMVTKIISETVNDFLNLQK